MYTPIRVAHGVGGHALGADTYGVKPDIIECGNLGGTLWVDGALVVDTIGEEDDYFALSLAVFDAVDGGGETVAEGGAVFYHTAFQRGELFKEHVVVDGEGHLSECLAGEYHKTHAVVFSALDEVGSDILGCFESVGSEVFGEHASADIDGQHDVNAFHLHFLTAEHALRAGKGDDQCANGYHAENEQQGISPLAERWTDTFEQVDA